MARLIPESVCATTFFVSGCMLPSSGVSSGSLGMNSKRGERLLLFPESLHGISSDTCLHELHGCMMALEGTRLDM